MLDKVFAICPGFVVWSLWWPYKNARRAGERRRSANARTMILAIMRGQRDEDAGKLVHAGGRISMVARILA
ncbi:uncharacterized protein V1518DRAFT_419386 [Limtongia smithiae]|uniref:uncharacterized protein n=1 Tax=Limtongia smithiae TaxID=1125753 RepID=UPI0034CE73CF